LIKNDLFKNKYRIPSNRLSSWDYGENAPYFVTICKKTGFIISETLKIIK